MVSINKVYQTVLAIANKEQRGYITPQEFNLFADQAQMDIFEQYFYDLNQVRRIPGNSTNTADHDDILEEKISIFHKSDVGAAISFSSDEVLMNQFTDYYKILSVRVKYTNFADFVEAEKLSSNELTKYLSSPLAKPSFDRPVYTIYSSGTASLYANSTVRLKFYPGFGGNSATVKIDYIAKPPKPNWTYIAVNEKPLYNSNAADHMDFTLHASEQKKLVIKILQLAGITIKDYNVTQFANQEEVKTIQQQKS
jgi:hypothetical protein